MDRISRRGFALAACAAAALALPSCDWDGNFTLLGYSTCPNYDPNIKTIRVPIFKSRTPWSVLPVPGMEMDLTRLVIQEIQQKTPFRVVSADCDADTELLGTIISWNKSVLVYSQLMEGREWETTLIVGLTWRDLRTGEILSLGQKKVTPVPGLPLVPDPAAPLAATPTTPGLTPSVPITSAPVAPTTGAVVIIPAEPDAAAGPAGPGTPRPAGPAAVVPGEGGPGVPPPNPPGTVPTLPTVATTGLTGAYPQVLVRSIAHVRPEIGQSTASAEWVSYQRMATQIVSMMEKPW